MEILYKVNRLLHDGFEKKGFILNRPNGTQDYVLIHFKTPVNIYQAGEIIKAGPGACILYTPESCHWFEPDGCDLIHDWMHFAPADTQALKALEIPFDRIFYPSRTYFITQAIMNCGIEFIQKEMFWPEAISAQLSLLFMQLSREAALSKTEVQNAYMIEMKNKFKQFRIKLYHSAQEDWNIDKMSCQLALSRSRFSVLYHDFFGVSPKMDLIKARIERAKYLLFSVDQKVEEIAYMSGYTNPYHFIRQFKMITGITPGEYRAQRDVANVE